MKKYLYLGLFGAVILSSCSDRKIEFAEYVAEYVATNKVDSLAMVYPEAIFDSISFSTEYNSIETEKTDVPNVVRAKFGESAYIDIKEDEGGVLSIVESSGIAAFPEQKLELAKKAGAVNDSITDIALAENMAIMDDVITALYDEAVEEYNKSISIHGPKITKQSMFMMDQGLGYFTLQNNTDRNIAGDEYTVVWRHGDVGAAYQGMGVDRTEYSDVDGKNIPAHGSVQYDFSFDGHNSNTIARVDMKPLTMKAFLETYDFTGKEFDEYVKENGRPDVLKTPGPLSLPLSFPKHLSIPVPVRRSCCHPLSSE